MTIRSPETTRERILDAALDVFANKGFHDARLDEIVEESGTSKGSIYFHFPNKERLFLALIDKFVNLLERRVVAAIEQEPVGMGRVRTALVTVISTFGQYRRPAKLLLVQAGGLGKPFEEKRREISERFARLIEIYLKEAIAIGDIAPVDTDVVALAWMGAIEAVIIRWVYMGEPEPARILDALLPVLLHSVGYNHVAER